MFKFDPVDPCLVLRKRIFICDVQKKPKTIGDLWFIPVFDGYQKWKQITGGSQGEV